MEPLRLDALVPVVGVEAFDELMEVVIAERVLTPPRGRREYRLEDHFGDKPTEIVDLYNQLHERIAGLGEDLERVVRKQYVGYRIGKSAVCSVIPQKRRLRLVLPLDPRPLVSHQLTRDLTDVGHWGVGDLEVTYDNDAALDQIMDWVKRAATDARG